MVFNLVGYRLLFTYQENRAQAQMIDKLDNNIYNKASLTEVKIALHLPYATNDKEFERYDGSIVLNGVTYNYVERKIANDTLVLHCIPNNTADKVKLAYTEYNKSLNDLQTPQKGQKSGNAALLLKSLECAGFKVNGSYAFNNVSFITQRTACKQASQKVVSGKFSQSPEQPPDAV